MNVAGFEEALASSVVIEIEPCLTAHVASVAGLTLLKLAAWVERGRESRKDAADLCRLPTSYADAGNTDRRPANGWRRAHPMWWMLPIRPAATQPALPDRIEIADEM